MDKSFDMGALLRNHKKHKSKPKQFESVAGGVTKRIQGSLKHRKSKRLTLFDVGRNLPTQCESPPPPPLNDMQKKVEHRKQQLEIWKLEKEKKKQEAAARKKKPFVTGVAHNPMRYIPLPPTKPVPSISGRVTRSQARKAKEIPLPKSPQSFAPKNAVFHPPKNIKNVPTMVIGGKPKKNEVVNKQMLFINPEPETTKGKTNLKSRPKLSLAPNLSSISSEDEGTSSGRSFSSNIQSSSENEAILEQRLSSLKTNSTQSQPKLKGNVKSKAKAPVKYQSSSENETSTSLSSIIESANENDNKPKRPIRSKTFTKSTKAAKGPKNDSQSSSENESIAHCSSDISKTQNMLSTPKNVERKSKSPRNYLTPNRVPKSESSSEEKLRSPKDTPITPEQVADLVKQISPCVTMSRGKDNARKEMKQKLREGLLDEDESNMENVIYYKRQLASEIERLTEKCVEWDKIFEQNVLPDFVQELVLAAVGQARLLMSQKMSQFGSLVQRCECPEAGQALVTPADLSGFWDMVFMQVVNIDMRFKKLKELQARNWVEEQPVLLKRKVVKPPVKPVVKPTVKAAGNSKLKEMIAAARLAKNKDKSLPEPEEKTFEAGFFSIRSPARKSSTTTPATASPATTDHKSTTPTTPRDKHNLLKAVLSNEAKKSANRASFAMLRASVLGRNVECDGVAPLPLTPLQPVKSSATPGRSILKQDSTKKFNRSIKVVLFNESDTTPKKINENTDSGVSSTDGEEKENTRDRKSLVRQNAVESPPNRSPVMTRSRRRSMQTPQTDKRTRNKVLEEKDINLLQHVATPKRSVRSRKSVV